MRCGASATSYFPSTAMSTTWWDLSTFTVVAWRSRRRTPKFRSRTLRNISFNPNFGGGTMVVSFGCEKLQPERLIPAGSMQARGAAGLRDYDLVTLQDPSHVGFDAMIGSIIGTAEQ